MHYLTLSEIKSIHERIIESSGGSTGIRDIGGLESAIAQPQMGFAGEELYPSLVEKAAALGFSLIMNHAFVDGNKRIGHAAMEVFLVVNGLEIKATSDEQEDVVLAVASGEMARADFVAWLQKVTVSI